jgi:hypothetical protein
MSRPVWNLFRHASTRALTGRSDDPMSITMSSLAFKSDAGGFEADSSHSVGICTCGILPIEGRATGPRSVQLLRSVRFLRGGRRISHHPGNLI